MKRHNITTYLMAAILGSMICTACQDEDTFDRKGEAELSFAPDVQRIDNQETITRATTTDGGFFKENDKITVEILTNHSSQAETLDYTLNDKGIFTGKFRFSLDNTYITSLKAKWPSEAVWKKGIKLDQRKLEDYKQADRLVTPEDMDDLKNIMPTAEPVPLKFEHELSRFSFRMAGQNANGLDIQSLILELQYDDPDDGKDPKLPGAFWAYCDPNTGNASLILVPGIEIKGDGAGFTIVGGRYMIGMATVGKGKDQYTGGIWLKQDVDVTLKRNTDYLVTLTPEGYDLMATIEIHGFGQGEGFIGVPEKP